MEEDQKSINYNRIAKAIAYIIAHHDQQPSLEEIADHVHLSSFHFQRIFQEWAGTTPKKFLQYISLSQAKKILDNQQSLFMTSDTLGLSSPSRLHDLFVNIEAMTPNEYRNKGQYLTIHYSLQYSPFGKILIASTSKGICQISFIDKIEDVSTILKKQFTNATYLHQVEECHLNVLKIFELSSKQPNPINVHLKGTAFQLKVWEALLQIPLGKLDTYGNIAQAINQPTASRAVGTAIGNNPLAYLIPCHRIIQASGVIGGYRWDPIRKTAIIGWEKTQTNSIHDETF